VRYEKCTVPVPALAHGPRALWVGKETPARRTVCQKHPRNGVFLFTNCESGRIRKDVLMSHDCKEM
jgi:hypothetical protein